MGLGLGGAKRLVNSFRDRITAGRRDSRDDHEVEVTNSRGQSVVVIVDDTTQSWRSQAPHRCDRRPVGIRRDQTRASRAGRDRGRKQSVQACRRRRVDCSRRWIDGEAGAGLEILAVDSGRGMSDVGRCVADGYSTAGSPGHGLGAIGRLADCFEIYSTPDLGTVLWARLDRQPQRRAGLEHGLKVGVVRVAAPGEDVCGDAWATVERDGRTFILMVDGLGHGTPAAQAAEEAVRIFRGDKPLVSPN